jgi:hypothetical protein
VSDDFRDLVPDLGDVRRAELGRGLLKIELDFGPA